MSLDFVKNTANYLNYGTGTFNTPMSGAAKVVISAWIAPDTFSTSTDEDNKILQTYVNLAQTGVNVNIDNFTSADAVIRIAARSAGAETKQIVRGNIIITTGSWWHVGAEISFSGDSITIVTNGVIDATTGVTFSATTYTPGSPPTVSDSIGANGTAPPTLSEQFDGRIAELAIWTLSSSDLSLTADEWNALGKGYVPTLVRPGSLIFYEPFIYKRTSPKDIIGGLTGTVTGTLSYADHTLVRAPRKDQTYTRGTAVYGIPLSATSPRSIILQRTALLVMPAVAVPHVPTLVRMGQIGASTFRSVVAALTVQIPTITAIAASVTANVIASLTVVRVAAQRTFFGSAGLGIHIRQARRRWTRRR